jgi:branched-chain amino acid transport system substrate-binding protein
MNKKVLAVLGAVVVVVIGAVVFLNRDNEKQEVIKIGAILPLTGNIAFLGETGRNGLSIAEDYINTNDLLYSGQKIKFVFSDGMGVPKTSINALNHLLDIEKIKIVFSIVSSVDVSFVPIQKVKRFLFISHATHPALSSVDTLFFRHSPTVEQEVDILKQYVANEISATSLLNMSDDYGIAFANLAIQEGFIMPENIFTFNLTDQDFRTFCMRVIQRNPSKIIICGNGKELYKIINALIQLGYKSEIITTLGFKVGGAFEQVKNTAEFTYIDFKRPTIDTQYSNVLTEYKNKYNKDMNVNEMIFFNSVLLLVEAINKSTDPYNIDEIAKILSNTKSFQGLGENTSITETNDILPELEILFNKK